MLTLSAGSDDSARSWRNVPNDTGSSGRWSRRVRSRNKSRSKEGGKEIMLGKIVRPALIHVIGLALVGSGLAQGPNWVERLASYPAELVKDKKTDAEVAEILFQAAMKRAPTAKDKDVVAQFLGKAKVRETACQDVLWALVSTKEFA